MGTSHRTSLSFLIGLGAAGCMPHSAPAPNAANTPSAPVLNKPVAGQPEVPLLGEGSNDTAQRVLVESVNDNVNRVSQILRQRDEAKRFASDIREQREAIALNQPKSQASDPHDEPKAVASTDTKSHQVRDPSSADSHENTRTVENTRTRENSSQRDSVLVPTETIPPERVIKPSPGEPVTVPAIPPQDAWANTGLSAAQPRENGDFGDAVPARRMQGSISAPVEVQRVGPTANPGGGLRSPGIDPLLAVQEQFLNRVNDEPKNLAAQLELQLARLLRNEPVPAMADLSTLAGEDRELIAAVSDALSNFRSLVRNDPSPLGSEKARPFIEMADRIRARSDLNIQSVNLCTSVKTFGNYEPIEPLQFVSGNPTWTVFYCEVDGFLSQLNDKQTWESRLSLELRLYNEAGLQVWNIAPETVTDLSRKRRRDFFIAKRIQLSSKLAPGPYMLKASIRDLQANRVAESTLQVSIVGK